MSNLLARILLALLMFPLAVLVFTITMILVSETANVRNEEMRFAISGVVGLLFVGGYWLLLWRRTVRWTPGRRAATAGAIGIAVVAGAVVGGLGALFEPSFGIFLGSCTAALAWLLVTIRAWRETDDERFDRVRFAPNAGGLVCPACRYNMSGLREATCPECGAAYSIDELIAAQPGADGARLEESE